MELIELTTVRKSVVARYDNLAGPSLLASPGSD